MSCEDDILGTPAIAKKDGIFTIRGSSDISATAQDVYARMIDIDRYEQWNTFTPRVHRTNCSQPDQLNLQDEITLEANIACTWSSSVKTRSIRTNVHRFTSTVAKTANQWH